MKDFLSLCRLKPSNRVKPPSDAGHPSPDSNGTAEDSCPNESRLLEGDKHSSQSGAGHVPCMQITMALAQTSWPKQHSPRTKSSIHHTAITSPLHHQRLSWIPTSPRLPHAHSSIPTHLSSPLQHAPSSWYLNDELSDLISSLENGHEGDAQQKGGPVLHKDSNCSSSALLPMPGACASTHSLAPHASTSLATQHASTYSEAQHASSHSGTQHASTRSVTQHASIHIATQHASAYSAAQHAGTHSAAQHASAYSMAQHSSTRSATQQASTYSVAQHASTGSGQSTTFSMGDQQRNPGDELDLEAAMKLVESLMPQDAAPPSPCPTENPSPVCSPAVDFLPASGPLAISAGGPEFAPVGRSVPPTPMALPAKPLAAHPFHSSHMPHTGNAQHQLAPVPSTPLKARPIASLPTQNTLPPSASSPPLTNLCAVLPAKPVHVPSPFSMADPFTANAPSAPPPFFPMFPVLSNTDHDQAMVAAAAAAAASKMPDLQGMMWDGSDLEHCGNGASHIGVSTQGKGWCAKSRHKDQALVDAILNRSKPPRAPQQQGAPQTTLSLSRSFPGLNAIGHWIPGINDPQMYSTLQEQQLKMHVSFSGPPSGSSPLKRSSYNLQQKQGAGKSKPVPKRPRQSSVSSSYDTFDSGSDEDDEDEGNSSDSEASFKRRGSQPRGGGGSRGVSSGRHSIRGSSKGTSERSPVARKTSTSTRSQPTTKRQTRKEGNSTISSSI